MFFKGQLIISYIHDADQDRYLFRLTGGKEYPVTREQFFAHLERLRRFEARQQLKHGPDYRPLPITVATYSQVKLHPLKLKQANHDLAQHLEDTPVRAAHKSHYIEPASQI